eukprot:492579-Amphidinium_carterae.1
MCPPHHHCWSFGFHACATADLESRAGHSHDEQQGGGCTSAIATEVAHGQVQRELRVLDGSMG